MRTRPIIWEETHRRPRRVIGGALLTLVLSAAVSHASELEQQHEFNIESVALGRAMDLLHQQTGLQLIYPYDQADTVLTQALKGRYTLQTALSVMLEDTDFCGGLSESGVIVISQENCALAHNREGKTVPARVRKATLLSSVASFVFGVGAASAQVDGAEGESADRGSVSRLLDTVVVTATKKQDAENVQDVALSVSAYNSDTIDALNVQDLEDLTFSAPNVSLDGIGTFRGFAGFSIRGLGTTSSIPSIDPTVGVFIDGIYLGTSQGVIFDLFDLDSIEILRGPQGLLFGRNTTGGAVVVNTANPTDELTFKTKASIEVPIGRNFGAPAEQVQAIISGPIIPGKLNAKLGVYFENDDGFFRNQVTGGNQAAADTLLLRGALQYFVNDDINFLAKVEYLDASGNGPGVTNFGIFDRDAESFEFGFENPGLDDSSAITASLRTDINVGFGDGTITNIFGYRSLEQEAVTDVDITANQIFDIGVFTDQQQFSNELRYAGTFGSLDVTSGLFFFRQDLDYDEFRVIAGGNVRTAGGGSQDHLVLGAFTNFNINLTEKLILSGGLRYSFERKDGFIAIIDGDGLLPDDSFCSVTGNTCTPDFAEEPEFDGFTPRAAIQFFPTDNLQLYANYSRGFRSGVFNFRTTSVASAQAQIAATGSIVSDQESLNAFEAGWKYQTPDARGKFNLAAFYTAIDDLIRDVTVSDPVAGVQQSTTNTGDAEIYGVEVETSYALTDRLLLSGTFGYLEQNYRDVIADLTGDGVINDDDFNLELTRAPKINYGISLVHDRDLGRWGGMTTTINYAYRDRIALTDNNLGFDDPQQRLNFDITWRAPREGLTFSIYGQNILNSQSAAIDAQLPFAGGAFSDGEATPFTAPAAGTFAPLRLGRNLGFEVKYQF